MNMEPQNMQQIDGEPMELSGHELRFSVSIDDLYNENDGDEFAGQERAENALELGTGVEYNIYVSGLGGVADLKALQEWFERIAADRETPGDFVYVNNFKNPDSPHAIYLKPGEGVKLKRMMADLLHSLRRDLPAAFRKEAFDREKSLLKEKYRTRSDELNQKYDDLAKEKGFVIQTSQDGKVFFLPVVNGKPLESPEEFANLPEEKKIELGKMQEELTAELEKLFLNQREILKEMEADIRQVERKFAETILSPLVRNIAGAIHDERIDAYLEEVKEYVLSNLDRFKEHLGPPLKRANDEKDAFIEFDVNVSVDNSHTQGAPVIVESSPGYSNLFGNIERVVDRFGRVVTNFTRIKAGSLLRAHGGYLIVNLADALGEPAVWKTLKRTLKTGKIEIETYEPFAMFSSTGLKPESFSIKTRVIVFGSYYLYNLLYMLDEDFPDAFKIRADFRSVMEMERKNIVAYIRWIRKIVKEKNLVPIDKEGILRVIEYGARRSEDKNKITASREILSDLVREASFVAAKEESKTVLNTHVEQALLLRQFRNNRIEQEMQDLTEKEVILIDLEGKKVGQLNALSVLAIGEYAFGRPSRLTATVSMGQAGIINIEREAKMSGKIHDKGVFIMSGYLRSRFGKNHPINLTASISFEQSYSGIEGDSASSTELYVLLSALSGVPLRQDIGVTGSVNQLGEVQAIGGVNEKVEGFFDACKRRGLTGNHGVLIPEANIKNLVLRHDVIDAIEQRMFHIYPVKTIDEGIEILSGVRAGTINDEGTINYLVDRKLESLAIGMRDFNAQEKQREKREENGNSAENAENSKK